MSYSDFFAKIVSEYSNEELEWISKCLNKTYNIYDPEEVRWNKIEHYFSKTNSADLENLRSSVLSNRFISDLLFKYYICERVVKYWLIKNMLRLTNDIVAFEMTVGDSRIDICRINGGSYAYEIKTEYDSFERLASQMNDYFKAFEKVYVVVPQSRYYDIQAFIPNECGIITYRHTSEGRLVFSHKKRCMKHKCEIEACLSNLSSSDLSCLLKLIRLDNKGSKKHKFDSILDYSKKHTIWPSYKKLLKNKYRPNWTFIKEHFDEIIPIDIQSFFATNISPELLYEKQQERR